MDYSLKIAFCNPRKLLPIYMSFADNRSDLYSTRSDAALFESMDARNAPGSSPQVERVRPVPIIQATYPQGPQGDDATRWATIATATLDLFGNAHPNTEGASQAWALWLLLPRALMTNHILHCMNH